MTTPTPLRLPAEIPWHARDRFDADGRSLPPDPRYAETWIRVLRERAAER